MSKITQGDPDKVSVPGVKDSSFKLQEELAN